MLQVKKHSSESDVGEVLVSYLYFCEMKVMNSKDTKAQRDLFSNGQDQRVFTNGEQHCVLEFLNYIVEDGKNIFEMLNFM